MNMVKELLMLLIQQLESINFIVHLKSRFWPLMDVSIIFILF